MSIIVRTPALPSHFPFHPSSPFFTRVTEEDHRRRPAVHSFLLLLLFVVFIIVPFRCLPSILNRDDGFLLSWRKRLGKRRPTLGSKGINIRAFCKDYNAKNADKAGYVIPVEITVYDDKSFTFILKTPPASVLLLKAAGVEKGSKDPKAQKVGKVHPGATLGNRSRKATGSQLPKPSSQP